MSNEIATYSMILSKLSLGKSGTECPTKTQILAINSLIVIDNASTYGANECVKIDDIRKKVETWNYYLTVSPTSMSFGAGGGSKSFTVSSYKRKVLDGVEQSGDTSVSLKSTTISGTGFSLSGTTVSASANEGTSNRTGTVTITQNESNKTATISLSQSGDTISSYGEWTISVSANPTSVSSSGGISTITASAKRTVYWVSGDVTEETGNPTLSTNLGSLSSTASPSTLTLGENTSTSSRTATITATYSGKSATCTVTQAGATPSTTYTFSINPYKVNVGSSGGSGSVTISSYKTVGSSTYDVDYSIDSSTLPSWASFNKSTSTFTIQSTTSTTDRTAKVYFDQDESGKRDYAELTQAGAEPTIEYVFTISPWQVNVGASGGTGDIGVTSYKLVNGNQISLGYSIDSSTLPSWATYSNGRFTISSNSSTSSRSANVYFTQSESGKRDYATISQSGYVPPADNYVFTWDDGSTSSKSESFQATDAVSAAITLVSTKNGSNHPWSVSSKPSWITTSTTSSKVTISASDNSGSARSGTIVLTQSGSNKTLRINVSQAAYSATVEWRYKIGFVNGALSNISVVCRDCHAVGQTIPFTVTFLSYKSKYVDGVEDTSTRQYLDFSISSSQTWLTATKTTSSNANQGKFATAVSENGSTSNRTGTITVTQNESQKVITCDITQVGSDAFVASYFVKFRGSDTYPSEINFGLVTAPTSKEFEVESSFEIYTIASEYNSYNYQFGAVRSIYSVDNFMNFTDTSWFTTMYEVDGGSNQYDLLTINAPVSDGRDHAVPLYIVQSEYTGNIDWKYREITNSPILGQIMVKQAGNKIS